MDALKYIYIPLFEIMKTEFTILGYTFSFWDMFLVSVFITLVGVALAKMFGGD